MLLFDIKKVHCLFEQSGHFKKVFKSIGIDSYDYDIENQFNETDYVIDLFKEIENARNDLLEHTIFDDFRSDLVIAFFPCIKFTEFFQLIISCNQKQLKNMTPLEKCVYSRNKMVELSQYYGLFCDLVYLSYKYDFKLIIENPYSFHNFLKHYFPFKADIVIMNRQILGDYFVKPTQFWFFNLEPIFTHNHYYPRRSEKLDIEHSSCYNVSRSLISEEFIKYFIQEYIIEDIDFNIPP